MTKRRTVAVLTTGRQDYGILRSTLRLLQDDPRFVLQLWVGGMHLRDRFGRTIRLIRADGFPVAREIDLVAEPPDPLTDAARALDAVGQALTEERPDALFVVGDRAETLAAGFAATLCRVPLVHLHGGEETEGAIDNVCRHALTKLSHLHLVSHNVHARRVIQMGEDPAAVVVVGAPGLDNLYRADLPDRAALEQEFGIVLEPPVVIVTVHPTTLAVNPEGDVSAVAAAMERVSATYVVTQPNADAGGVAIRAFWKRWVQGRERVRLVDGLGETRYWGLLRQATAILGNSSSGIIEAPAAGVPVVNVGDRQKGRLRGPSTRDVPPVTSTIVSALREALRSEKKATAEPASRVYMPGPAAPRIVAALKAWSPPLPPRKAFSSYAQAESDARENEEES